MVFHIDNLAEETIKQCGVCHLQVRHLMGKCDLHCHETVGFSVMFRFSFEVTSTWDMKLIKGSR